MGEGETRVIGSNFVSPPLPFSHSPPLLLGLQLYQRSFNDVGDSRLDDGEIAGKRRGVMKSNLLPAFATCSERGRHRRCGVEDEQIAAAEKSRQIAKLRVSDLARHAIGDHQTDVVAAAASQLRGLTRLELRGQR